MAHPVQWLAPLPLWARWGDGAPTAAATADQTRPALLRFASDDFMEQLIGLLGRDPSRLAELLARPETWRTPSAAPGTDSAPLASGVPLPRVVQAALRGLAPTRATQPVVPVAASTSMVEQGRQRELPLKLFQPAHQRHYLVAASLVCAVPGLPERRVVPGGAVQVGFVLRRLMPASAAAGDTSQVEFAYAAGGGTPRWQRVSEGDAAAVLAPGEELLPLFPLRFTDELGHARTLWAGSVPVARREDYAGAPVERQVTPLLQGQQAALRPPAPARAEPAIRRRLLQFQMEVAEPWKTLVRSAATARAALVEPPASGMPTPGATAAELHAQRLQLNLRWQMQSWLILLDLADYIAVHLPRLWAALAVPAAAAALSDRERTLHTWLGKATTGPALRNALKLQPQDSAPDLRAPAPNLGEALRRIATPAMRQLLEGTTALYAAGSPAAAWPDFHCLLVGLDTANLLAGAWANLGTSPLEDATPADEVIDRPSAGLPNAALPGTAEALAVDRLTAAIARALTPNDEADAPPLSQAVGLAHTLAAAADATPWFVVRCVHLNHDCGPVHPPLTSAPSQRFQLANFFDADAPARPIRITLPADTTPAGLRKHSRNTAFVISDVLCGQIQRAKGLGLVDLVRSVLPWPLHKDLDVGEGGPCAAGGNSLGMICSLSIPIIAICALILLLIIVTLLDVIFRWLPYLVFCLPVLRLSGKSKENA